MNCTPYFTLCAIVLPSNGFSLTQLRSRTPPHNVPALAARLQLLPRGFRPGDATSGRWSTRNLPGRRETAIGFCLPLMHILYCRPFFRASTRGNHHGGLGALGGLIQPSHMRDSRNFPFGKFTRARVKGVFKAPKAPKPPKIPP